MRLYFAKILRRTEVSKGTSGPVFRFRIFEGDDNGKPKIKHYEADSIKALMKEIKKDHQVWGGDSLCDYADRPLNAFEYALMEFYLAISESLSTAEFNVFFDLAEGE